MTLKILKDIRFKLDIDHLLETLKITDRKELAGEFAKLAEEAEHIANPKALFRKVAIEEKGRDYVILEGVRFTSKVLRVNLNKTDIVYPALATCGAELDEWSKTKNDLLSNFWAESIKESILSITVSETLKRLGEMYNQENASLMTPGSINDWPLSEQEKLFELFENSHEEIGVSLTPSFMMRPLKSLSFLVFSAEDDFLSCQLCSMDDCLNRRAPFEEGLFEIKYRL